MKEQVGRHTGRCPDRQPFFNSLLSEKKTHYLVIPSTCRSTCLDNKYHSCFHGVRKRKPFWTPKAGVMKLHILLPNSLTAEPVATAVACWVESNQRIFGILSGTSRKGEWGDGDKRAQRNITVGGWVRRHACKLYWFRLLPTSHCTSQHWHQECKEDWVEFSWQDSPQQQPQFPLKSQRMWNSPWWWGSRTIVGDF